MKKAVVAVLASLMLTGYGGALELDSTISQSSCPADYRPVVSMSHPNKTYNNIGHPAIYDYKVCVKGIFQSNIDTSCSGATSFYISSNNTDAHFSNIAGYNLQVCTGNMFTEIRNSCKVDQTPLFSVSDRINGFGRHIAGYNPSDGAPRVYDEVVCGYWAPPENVTVSMTGNLSGSDEVYFDESNFGTSRYSGMAEFPYIVSTDGSTVTGIVAADFEFVQRELGEENTLHFNRDAQRASFIIPFTEGGYAEIEDDQQLILANEFINQIHPSFSFFSPSTATVRTLLRSGADIEGYISIDSGRHRIKIEKTGENQITISEVTE